MNAELAEHAEIEFLLVLRIPISISGVGVQEGLLGTYFVYLGYSLESAVLLSVLLRLLGILVTGPGGLLFLGEGVSSKSLQRPSLQTSAKSVSN